MSDFTSNEDAPHQGNFPWHYHHRYNYDVLLLLIIANKMKYNK